MSRGQISKRAPSTGSADTKIARKALLATSSALALAAALGSAAQAAPQNINALLTFTNPSGTNRTNGVVVTATPSPQGSIVNAGTFTITSTNTAIAVTGATTTLLGTISNAGTISVTNGAFAIGVGAGGASISGGIVSANSGLIAVSASSNAVGLAAASTVFNGGLTNAGRITVTGSTALGIVAGATNGGGLTASFGGGITNSGSVTVTVVATSPSSTAVGIAAGSSTFSGGIVNGGLLTVSNGPANAIGIAVGAATFGNGVTNAGTVNVTGSTAVGIIAGVTKSGGLTASFGGGITNSGGLTVVATSPTSTAVGIAAGSSTFSGGIVNAAGGLISVSNAPSNAVGIAVGAATFNNGITNAGTMNVQGSTALGIVAGVGRTVGGAAVLAGSMGGGITNTGMLTVVSTSPTSTAQGIQAGGTVFSGDVSNSGSISVSDTGAAKTAAVGIRVGIGSQTAFAIPTALVPNFQGSVVNTSGGVITVSALNSATGIQVNASTFTGGITNAGTVRTTATDTTAGHLASGIGISVVTVKLAGGITNSGLVSGAGGSEGIGVLLQADGGSIGGLIANSGTVNASAGALGAQLAVGIWDQAATLGGGISSSGAITATANGNAVGILVASNPGGTHNPTLFSGGITIASSGVVTVTSGPGVAAGIAESAPTFLGGINNAGAMNITGSTAVGISAGVGRSAGGAAVLVGSVGGGVTNSGKLTVVSTSPTSTAQGIQVGGSTFTGNVSNSGTVSASAGNATSAAVGIRVGIGSQTSFAVPTTLVPQFQGSIINAAGGLISGVATQSGTGLQVNAVTFTGGITNAGTIRGSGTGSGVTASGIGISVVASSFAGGITNSGGLISGAGNTVGVGLLLQADAGSIGGLVSNSGKIVANAPLIAAGIWDQAATLGGGVSNSGTVSASANAATALSDAFGIAVIASPNGTHFPTLAAGGIVNSGLIAATNGKFITAGIDVGLLTNGAVNTLHPVTFTGGITNAAQGVITASSTASALAVGIEEAAKSFANGINNAGTISASSASNADAIFVAGAIVLGVGSTFTGGITNSGLLSATTSSGGGVGILVSNLSIGGGITNTGTINAFTAIDLRSESAGNSTVVNQAGGAINGAIGLSANADQLVLTGGLLNGAVTGAAGNHDVVSVPSGTPTLAAGATINGVSSFTQTGGTLVVQLGAPAAPGAQPAAGTFPTVNAGAINLNGTLQTSLQGSLANFVGTPAPTFKDVFVSGAAVTGTETVTTTSVLFNANLTPDAATANGLDLTVALSPAGEALTAQMLVQALRFGLVDQQVIVNTVENRMQVSENNHGQGMQFASLRDDHATLADASGQQAPLAPAGSGGGGQLWGRVYGTAGHANATATLPAFDEKRAGGIVGADWRMNEFAFGIGFNYAVTDAPFADGSHAGLNTYQGLVYGGWRNGPAYVTGLASGGANSYSLTRNMVPFGLTGSATSSPSGVLATIFGEAGYGFGLGSATLTPYVNVDYVHQHLDAFTESGGFGALSVAAASGDSLQTTVGLRASTAITLGNGSTLVPEVRAGWGHEFLDQSQTLTAQLAGTTAAPFTVVGTQFGRDSALVGVGVSHEFMPGGSFFIDYDGKFTGGFDQHTASAGIKIKF